MKILSIIILVLIFVALFVPEDYIYKWTPAYILHYFEDVSNFVPFPNIAESIKFDGLLSSIKSTVFIASYPMLLITWLLIQLFSFVQHFFGGWEVFFS